MKYQVIIKGQECCPKGFTNLKDLQKYANKLIKNKVEFTWTKFNSTIRSLTRV